MSKLYIGKQKVSESNEVDGKVKYVLANGQTGEVLQVQFDHMAKEQPYEDEMVRVHQWNPCIEEVMRVLLKYDMTILEKPFVLDRVDTTIVNNYGLAAAKLFGAESGYEGDITLSMIDKALKG